MARCTYCGGGGAKRSCPALNGQICPRCCAQNQRRAITCPEECVFLRAPGGKDAYQVARDKLVAFAFNCEAFAGPALSLLAGPEKRMGEWEQPLVIAYIAHGYANVKGERAIDAFLRLHGAELKLSEAEALQALRDTAWPSLFEVQRIELDVGFQCLDLVTGEELFVHEKMATHSLKKFDVLLTWVARFGEHLGLTADATGVPRQHLKSVLEATMAQMRQLRSSNRRPERELLREAVVVAQQTLRKAIENWQPPKLMTMDGEEVIFCEAIFDVADGQGLRKKLQAHPNLEGNENVYDWLDRKGRPQLGGSPLRLGTVRVDGARLVLETQSRERLERGKQLLVEYLGVFVRHRLDSVKDLDVAMQEHATKPPPRDARAIPEEVQAEILGPFLQKRLGAWVDEALPALQGKSPRQAVKTQAGRARVLALLKDHENLMQRQPGGDSVDFSSVYRALGLVQG